MTDNTNIGCSVSRPSMNQGHNSQAPETPFSQNVARQSLPPVKIVVDWIQPISKKARARRTDHAVSHDAAKRVELGKAERQRLAIKYALTCDGPMTVNELGSYLPWPKHELGKRIAEVDGIAPTGEVRNGSRVWALI